MNKSNIIPFMLGFASAAGLAALAWAKDGSAPDKVSTSNCSNEFTDDPSLKPKRLELPEVRSESARSRSESVKTLDDEIPSPSTKLQERYMDIGFADSLHDSLLRPCFKSLEAAALVLRMARAQNDARLISKEMHTFFGVLSEVEKSHFLRRDGFCDTRVLVVEGLSGCGKSTILEAIQMRGDSDNLDLMIMKAPTEVLDVADTFSGMPFAVAVAFEFIKLYIMSWKIATSGAKVVLVERYYHDSFARSLLDHGLTIEDIASDPLATLFDWPQDLPQPTLVLYLAVRTAVRLGRRVQAGASPERSVNRASIRDSNLQAIHSKIRGPQVVAIDANGSASDVASTAFEALEAYGLPLRSSSSSPQRVSLGIYGPMAEVLPGSPINSTG